MFDRLAPVVAEANETRPYRPRWTRRGFLYLGGAGLVGLALPKLPTPVMYFSEGMVFTGRGESWLCGPQEQARLLGEAVARQLDLMTLAAMKVDVRRRR